MGKNIPILALDLATKTGWALRDRTKTITSGVQTFDLKRGESAGMRFLRFRKWLRDMINLGSMGKDVSETTPGLIVYEQPHFRGGSSTQLLVGLATDVLAEAASYGLEHTAVHTASLKKWAAGGGKASKEKMIEVAKSNFPDIEILDDNHADALLLMKYGMEEVGLA